MISSNAFSALSLSLSGAWGHSGGPCAVWRRRGAARACVEAEGPGGGGRAIRCAPSCVRHAPTSPMAQGLALAWLASLYRINRYTFKVSWLTLPALRRPQSGQCGPARRRAPRAPRRRRVCHWHCHVPVHRPHPAKCEQCDVCGVCVRARRSRAPRVLVSGRAAAERRRHARSGRRSTRVDPCPSLRPA
jgi:hypothetical protein